MVTHPLVVIMGSVPPRELVEPLLEAAFSVGAEVLYVDAASSEAELMTALRGAVTLVQRRRAGRLK